MADRRMFDRAIFKSQVMCALSEKNPKMELEAQRIFEILILFADDYGRGRILLSAIKLEAFGTSPNVFAKVGMEDIEKWLKQMAAEEAINIYTVKGNRYYELTGWDFYQSGKWYKRQSNIPLPPKSKRESTAVKSRTSEPSKASIKLVKELFPKEMERKNINKEARVLDELHEVDGYSLDDIRKTLKWARTNWHWKDGFKSCESLRRVDAEGKSKFKSIIEGARGEAGRVKKDGNRPETGEVKL